MKVHFSVCFLLALALVQAASGQAITFDTYDAEVWARDQVVGGSSDVAQGVLLVNGEPVPFTAAEGSFSVPVQLGEGTTEIVACTPDEATCPDTLTLTLGYELRPEAELSVAVSGRTVTLEGNVLANPEGADLTFEWRPDPDNPEPVALSVDSDSAATLTLPETAPYGEYYFDWLVISDGIVDDTVRARTFVTVNSTGIEPFDIATDHAAWVDSAVVYGVSPYNMNDPGNLKNVRHRLPEVAALGVNTIWILPVYPTNDTYGPGYGVKDYFEVRSDYGTEEDLRALIETAHSLGMKVLFDFVPNHTHVTHPYLQHAAAYGDSSHYYNFYQQARGNDRYSGQLRSETVGKLTYFRYFWDELPNLNYDNPEVQRYITEAARYWIEEFDVDGYRIDAVWGARSRNPAFFKEWRKALKRVKPEVLLLGEDKATDPTSFEFWDAAYDWYNGDVWISEWAWQPGGHNSPTIFTTSDENRRSDLLRDALTNEGQGWHPDATVFRFMENNDTERFIVAHGPERTKMAAALLFSLPGLPLVFNGQEIGDREQAYANNSYPIFSLGKPIADHADQYGLYPYYEHLIGLRTRFPALYSDSLAEVPVQPSDVAAYTYAYRRWAGEQNVFGVINMADQEATAELELPVGDLGVEADATYYLNDLMNGEAIPVTGAELASVTVTVPGYTTRLFALADSVMNVGLPTPVEPPTELPARVALAQNYPNPFNPSTAIAFELPHAGRIRLAVFDVLGREVAVLQDQEMPAGRHTVAFEAVGLPSGVYFYRLEFGREAVTRRMLLLK